MRHQSHAKPVVHLHCLCWNEEKMLPFFFMHYDPIVDIYYIADHGSTDKSRAILDDHPKVVLTEFPCSESSFVDSARNHYNECWKISRGKADWVLICNIDEHLYHPNLTDYLIRSRSNGITLIRPTGYNMVSDTFPTPEKSLQSQIRFGEREPLWDKPQFFNPDSIKDINFVVGRHSAQPTGLAKEDTSGRIKLLHYKYMGREYLFNRSLQLSSRMKPTDLINGWGDYSSIDKLEKASRIVKHSTLVAVPVYSPAAPLFIFLVQPIRLILYTSSIALRILRKIAGLTNHTR